MAGLENKMMKGHDSITSSTSYHRDEHFGSEQSCKTSRQRTLTHTHTHTVSHTHTHADTEPRKKCAIMFTSTVSQSRTSHDVDEMLRPPNWFGIAIRSALPLPFARTYRKQASKHTHGKLVNQTGKLFRHPALLLCNQPAAADNGLIML